MKRSTLAVAVLLLAGRLCAEVITVATVNVWSGLDYRGVFAVGEYEDRATRDFRFNLLTRELSTAAPDVIALQEANPLPAYAQQISDALGLTPVWAVRQAGVRIGPVGLPANLREGSVILADASREPVRAGTRQLSGPGAGDSASFQLSGGSHLLAARMTVADRPVYVLTTRWTPSPQADRGRLLELVDAYDGGQLAGAEFAGRVTDAVAGRERRLAEARETLVYANALAGEEPVILLGSFYALPDSPEIALLRDAGFVDVWRSVGRSDGFTRDGRTNANLSAHGLAGADERVRYDYIFVRGAGIAPRSARLILDRPTFGVHPSSHYGVLAELRVDPR